MSIIILDSKADNGDDHFWKDVFLPVVEISIILTK